MKITDEAIFEAMEAGGNEARAWSMIERGGKFLVHDLKRVAQLCAFDLTKSVPHDTAFERYVMDSRESAVSFVSFRTYRAAVEAALNYKPENDHEQCVGRPG